MVSNVPKTSRSAKDVVSSCTVYVGKYFISETFQWFRFEKLVMQDSVGGLVATTFTPLEDVNCMKLTPGGYRILTVPNAGGNSVVSEVLSFELLCRCFSARLQQTEMEVEYFPHGGSITDYVCELFNTRVGVSVTRAMKFRGDFCIDDAFRLLNKKLKGVIQSTQNARLKWNKQILHVWSTSHQVTHILGQAYVQLDPEVKANTVVLVTTATNAEYIFTNQ